MVRTSVAEDIPLRDRLPSGLICYRIQSRKSSNGVSSNSVRASKNSTVIAICTGVPAGTTATPGAPATAPQGHQPLPDVGGSKV
jgi:hypothetical protein